MEEDRLKEINDKVLTLSDEAFLFLRDNRLPESVMKYTEAFELERQAADWFIEVGEEPKRSKTCLNAAHLACDAGLMTEAEYYANQVITFGLNPDLIEEAKIILKQ